MRKLNSKVQRLARTRLSSGDVASLDTGQIMRVIAGQYRSRPLRSLPGWKSVRPRTGCARRCSTCCARAIRRRWPETTWLDLYAGTGAVGIEALSRGARMVYFVESSKAAAELIARELEIAGDCQRGFQIVKAEAAKALRQLEAAGIVADFVFLDPPYSMQRGVRERRWRRWRNRNCCASERGRSRSMRRDLIRERRLASCGAIGSWCRETRR